MQFGVCIPNYGETLSPEGLKQVVLETEELGFTSVWTTDHILMPKDSGTPYENILESVVTLAHLSSVTKRLKLGISSLVMALRNPVILAKQLETIDVLSGGRVMLATGAGWYEQEFSFLGSNFHDRGRRLNDSIRLIRALWRGEREFRGRYIPQGFNNGVFEPRPIQEKLPIWIAGNSAAAMRRATKLGDAWHPNTIPIEDFKQLVARFRGLEGAGEKDICARIALNSRAPQSAYTNPRGEKRLILSGNTEENKKVISEMEGMGVSHLLVTPNYNGKIPVTTQIESLRYLAGVFMK